MSQPTWTVDDYRTTSGARPVREALMKLSDDARAKVTAALTMLARRGNQLRLPMSRPMGGGLFEIRVKHPEGAVRIMYCFRSGHRIVLLQAFVKKTEQTPPGDLELARTRKRELEDREA